MPSTIVFHRYDLLAPLFSTDRYTEHLARPRSALAEERLVRLRIGHLDGRHVTAPERGTRIHPHVLRVTDAGQHEGVDFVAYEHVAGVRLSDVAASGSLLRRPACAVSIVLDALRAAHAYRGWLDEHAREVRARRAAVTSEDVWVGMDGTAYLSVVDLIEPRDVRAEASDVSNIGRALLDLVGGTPTRAARHEASSVEAIAARALGRAEHAPYVSSEAMSLALHKVAVREGLLASVEAVSAVICTSFSERIAAQRPTLALLPREDETEPTIIRTTSPRLFANLAEGPCVHDVPAQKKRKRGVRALALGLAVLLGGLLVAVADRVPVVPAQSVRVTPSPALAPAAPPPMVAPSLAPAPLATVGASPAPVPAVRRRRAPRRPRGPSVSTRVNPYR